MHVLLTAIDHICVTNSIPLQKLAAVSCEVFLLVAGVVHLFEIARVKHVRSWRVVQMSALLVRPHCISVRFNGFVCN